MRLLTVFLGAMVVAATIVGVLALDPSPAPASGPPPGVDYTSTASYGYVATLGPNVLYNSTTIANLTTPLFLSITKTVNFTLTWTFQVGAPSSIHVAGNFRVEVLGPSWSRTVANQTVETGANASRGASLKVTYSMQVSALLSLIFAIENETGSAGGSVFVVLSPALIVAVNGPKGSGLLGVDPALNLSVGVSTLNLGPLNQTSSGVVQDPGGTSVAPAASFWSVLLFAVLAASTATVGFWWVRSRGRGRRPDLEDRVRPFSDAVAETLNVPKNAELILLKDWDDLVKVADTLGRPILRYRGADADTKPSVFFVRDGTICYVFRSGPLRPADSAEVGADGSNN